jgi:CheY-like chemotaxis protein
MASETIIVVDDATVNLKPAVAVLRREGYRVHLASSAGEALMRITPHSPTSCWRTSNCPA